MPEESSRRAATTENTYTDIGADTPEGYRIAATSRGLARAVIGTAGCEDRIRQRCAIAVGDFVMADLMQFGRDPVAAGLAALARRAPIVSDIRMVQTGILKRGHGSEVLCALDFGAEIARETGMTRTSAGYAALARQLDGAVVVIGNAPSALLFLCDLIEEGTRPALVIGTPVGFVNARESKERLRTLDIPAISNIGTRGGTPVAVASMNEIITIHIEALRC
jgi:precorrin-8X/cobalt-precorrin-8 methylmutase